MTAETLDPKIEKNAIARPFAVPQKEQSKWVGLQSWLFQESKFCKLQHWHARARVCRRQNARARNCEAASAHGKHQQP